jgi:hypothetical protein
MQVKLFRRLEDRAESRNVPHPEAERGASKARPRVFHPFLIGIFPIVSLYAHNVYETPIGNMLVPLAISLVGTLVVWQVLRLLSRDALWAGLATSMLVAIFFGFASLSAFADRIAISVSTLWVARFIHVPPLVVLAMSAVAASLILWLGFWRSRHLGRWNSYLNLFTLILVAMPALEAGSARFREPAHRDQEKALPTQESRSGWTPDIYFIVLDGYSRTDVMKDLFGFDNEPFLSRLESRGFFAARQSTSNYCQTRLSIASTLNADYLPKLIDPGLRDLLPISSLIKENLVAKMLRPRGYKFVTFSTGFEPTDYPEADVYLTPGPGMPEFSQLLIEMTPVTPLTAENKFIDRYSLLRDRTLFLFDRLPTIAKMKEPTFTFAHIVSPHPPFVFGENGEDVSPRQQWGREFKESLGKSFGSPEYFRDSYRNQSAFLTTRVEQMIDEILANSPEPPVIILQSDHGSWLHYHPDDAEATDLRERFGILNCIYMPDHKFEGLNDRMTSVNTFRAVLRTVIGADLPTLEERNIFSPFHDPLVFTDVTERLHSDQEQKRKFRYPPQFPGLLQQF